MPAQPQGPYREPPGGRLRAGEKELSERQRLGREDVGRELRTLRERRGITLPRLAEACGLSRGYLSELETGRRLPSLDVLDVIAEQLGTTVTQVLAPTIYGRRADGH